MNIENLTIPEKLVLSVFLSVLAMASGVIASETFGPFF